MIDLFLRYAPDATADQELLSALDAHLMEVIGSAGDADLRQAVVADVEAAVQADPAGAFAFDAAGYATLTEGGQTWQAGRFEVVSLAALRERAVAARGAGSGRARLWVFDGASPMTDIGSLQATAGGGLFQVASQFNCLESPGRSVTRVAHYFNDRTQGPRASISAFPGTLLRHYRAPGANGERFVQETDGAQIDLLADVFAPGESPVRNGYLTAEGVADPFALVAALESRFDAIRVGAHDGVEVVLGYDWAGAVPEPRPRRIAQVFTSTVAGGYYGGERLGAAYEPTCRLLLRAAYLGTLLAAVALGRRWVVLTLIGGGVFGNPLSLIWGAILWALDEVAPVLGHDLDVVVNGRNLGTAIERAALLDAVRARGGAILAFDRFADAAILR
jgi:hypothetical protein